MIRTIVSSTYNEVVVYGGDAVVPPAWTEVGDGPVTGGGVAVDVVVLPSLPQHDAPLHVPVSSSPAYSCVGPLGIAVLQSSVVLVGWNEIDWNIELNIAGKA